MRLFSYFKRYYNCLKDRLAVTDTNSNSILDYKGNPLNIESKSFDECVFAVDSLNKRIKSLSGQFVIQEIFTLLENIYIIADSWTQLLASHCPCQPGCCACCHELFPVYSIEAEYIRHYIMADINLAEQSRLKQDLNVLHKLITLPSTQCCPFLSSDGLCNIYHARPLVCRTHIVITPAEDCSKMMGRPIEGGIPIILMDSVYTLALWYSNSFKLPITMSFPEWFQSGFQQKFMNLKK